MTDATDDDAAIPRSARWEENDRATFFRVIERFQNRGRYPRISTSEGHSNMSAFVVQQSLSRHVTFDLVKRCVWFDEIIGNETKSKTWPIEHTTDHVRGWLAHLGIDDEDLAKLALEIA